MLNQQRSTAEVWITEKRKLEENRQGLLRIRASLLSPYVKLCDQLETTPGKAEVLYELANLQQRFHELTTSIHIVEFHIATCEYEISKITNSPSALFEGCILLLGNIAGVALITYGILSIVSDSPGLGVCSIAAGILSSYWSFNMLKPPCRPLV
jgi:hypothetical protein